jgi:hypothetical protein
MPDRTASRGDLASAEGGNGDTPAADSQDASLQPQGDHGPEKSRPPRPKKSMWRQEKPHYALVGLVKFFAIGYLVYVYGFGEEWSGIDSLYFSIVTITTGNIAAAE